MWRRRVYLRASLALTVAIAVASVVVANGQEAKKRAEAPARKGGAAAKAQGYDGFIRAMEIREAFADLQQAVDGRGRGEVPKPARPEKVVTAPTLDAKGLDRLVAKSLESAGATPAVRAGDAEFLRRVYLDVTGKPPTVEQIAAFLESKDAKKRSRVIDELLESPDYAQNWARYWRDVIGYRSTNPQPLQTRLPVLQEWLAEQIGENVPWDEVATDLITAEGRVDEVGPANFYAAHAADPVEVAGEVSRVFLGLQIQCAQCHDHPYDPWKREQFHQFAAFFAGSRLRPIYESGQMGIGPRSFEVIERGRNAYSMPDLADPAKQVPVAPRFTLVGKGEPVDPRLPVGDKRALAASYVTGQDNPWFSRAYVNRVWSVLMGEGFFNPIDDLGENKESRATEVLDALAESWTRSGYDGKWLFRAILNSEAYQREERDAATAAPGEAFAAVTPSRLRSDQILDSLGRVLGFDPDQLPQAGRLGQRRPEMAGMMMAGANNAMQQRGIAALFSPRNRFNTVFGVDPSTPSDEVTGTIPQALLLMNGPNILQATSARPATMLGKLLAKEPDDRKALELLYLHVLSRRPGEEEVRDCVEHIAGSPRRQEGFEDVLWCLINSAEFISRK